MSSLLVVVAGEEARSGAGSGYVRRSAVSLRDEAIRLWPFSSMSQLSQLISLSWQ